VKLSEGQPPLLFLLDEIFHGTNSHDRRIGAGAVVRALIASGAVGLLTTHDLALAELAAQIEGTKNVHFADQLLDGRLVFDYLLHDGVVTRSNALELMRAVGLPV
jgi:DNA mismatch repair ATPase MutS